MAQTKRYQPSSMRKGYRAAASPKPPQRDYIGTACTTAGVSLRKALTPDELVRALLTGRANNHP